MINEYDYIIVGAGPSGLTCAQTLSKMGNRCLIVERENDIGGCHRVRRVDGFFCEHGPRIYASAYVNFLELLDQMNIDFNEFFTPYNFSIMSIASDNTSSFNINEMAAFVKIWMWGTFVSKNYSKSVTVLDFATFNNFSKESIATLDRLCRLSDGAGADRYTLFEFIELVNQNVFYTIYQPKIPNDLGLFSKWKKALGDIGVDIVLKSKIDSIISQNKQVICSNSKSYFYKKALILATPPRSFLKIKGLPITKQQHNSLEIFEKNSRYEVYIPIVFHYDKKINLKKQHGSSGESDWEIAYIVLSDYMTFQNPSSKTVISVAITNTNVKSNFIGKTANQSTEKELIEETFRQLTLSTGPLPNPTKSIISPGVFRNNIKGEWDTVDDAYVRPITKLRPFIPFKLSTEIYNVGTHNGEHFYDFTSIEAAVTNALHLCKILHPSSVIGPLKRPVTLDGIVRLVFLIILIGLFINRKMI